MPGRRHAAAQFGELEAISWSDTAYPEFRRFIFRISCRNLLILLPSCHFENVLANDDKGFAVSTSPEAVEERRVPCWAYLEELSSWRRAIGDMGVARSMSETVIYF